MFEFQKEKEQRNLNKESSKTRATTSQQEKGELGAVVSQSGKKSPSSKVGSDQDRKKFFQSLLQTRNGPNSDSGLPKTIPEEKESESVPSSPARVPTDTNDANAVTESDAIQVTRRGVDAKSAAMNQDLTGTCASAENCLSATGVGSDIRGAEVAEDIVDRKIDPVDEGPSSNAGAPSEIEQSRDLNTSGEIETIEPPGYPIEPDKIVESGKSAENKSAESLPRRNRKMIVLCTEKSGNAKQETRTSNESVQSASAGETHLHSTSEEDLLDDKNKPRDVDSNLSIAVKSSYIGTASEVDDDVQPRDKTEHASVSVLGNEPSPATDSKTKDGIPSTSLTQTEESIAEDKSAQSLPVEKTGQTSLSNCASPGDATSSPAVSSTGSPSTAAPNNGEPFRAHVNIPEFLWSAVHQRLLGDLLFAIESDVHVWRR